MRRLVAVLNYFSSFTNDDLITFLPSSNMMVRLALFPSAISVIVPSPKTLCLTLSPMSKFAMISLPNRLSKKYQVNQVNHEVGKKHHKHKTYKKPNILILIKIPCKYFVIISPRNYLVNHLFLLMYANTTKMANMMMTIMCMGNYLVFDFFFHFQKKYKPTPNRIYTPMNIYIGFTLSPKRYAMRRLRVVLNYFSSFTNDDLITFLPSSNMMVRLALFPASISTIVPSPKTLCLTLSPMSNFAIYLSSFFISKFNNNNKLLI